MNDTNYDVPRDDSYKVINVVLRSLGEMDIRLTEHGSRVAYIICKMLKCVDDKMGFDDKMLIVLSFLHDIGAYKMEEVNSLLTFDVENTFKHAVYGYLFLKNFTKMDTYAEAVLHHHTSYDKLVRTDCSYREYAMIMHLADRVDILIRQGLNAAEEIKKGSGTEYAPILVDMYIEAEERFNITNHINNGEFEAEINEIIAKMRFTEAEVLDFLKLLVFAMDFRSPNTVSHTANTSHISVKLGELFELGRNDMRSLYYGAVFHDLGKIAIPVDILEKAGSFTAEEMRIMKTHVEITELILRGIVDDSICDIAVRHHEKLDGSGYPWGLVGSELTPMQRIVGVADIASALIGRRSYKEPFSKEDTIKIISDMSKKGKQCPAVCKALIDNYDSIIASALRVDEEMDKTYVEIERQFRQVMVSNRAMFR